MEFLSVHASEIISFAAGGAAGSLLTLFLKSLRGSGSANVIDQSRAKAGGDIVGRDKKS